MQHFMENGRCLVCLCTQDDLDKEIAPADCLGPAGQAMRREAFVEILERRAADAKAKLERSAHDASQS